MGKRIGEDILQHMHLFTKFGQMVSDKKTSEKVTNRPFQRLMFLVRDWGSPKQHYYGNEGGEAHLADVLNVQDDGEVNQELVEVGRTYKHALMTWVATCCHTRVTKWRKGWGTTQATSPAKSQ